MDKAAFEAKLAAYPLYAYAFIRTDQLFFTERVRTICENECPMYGTSYACPPAVGSVEACRARCLSYPEALLIATIVEVDDVANMDETLATRPAHEALTREIRSLLMQEAGEVMVLSTEACAVCEHCAYPDVPCRHPEHMFPCVESHGILVTQLAESTGIDFYAEGNLVTWFSLLFFRDPENTLIDKNN